MRHALLPLLAGVALLTAVAAFIWPQLSLFLASDSCMATGGSFDFAQVRCDFQQNHAYATFALWPFWVAFTGGLLGIALVGRAVLRLRPNNSFKPKPLRGSA